MNKYEELEKELGCPIDVIFTALKEEEIYVKRTSSYFYDEVYEPNDYFIIKNLVYEENEWKFIFHFGYNIDTTVNIKDYRKTWFLKEDIDERR